MSVVEPVSRKRTRKVGLGRFIPQCRDIESARERVTNVESMPAFNMRSNRIYISTHRPALIPLLGIAAENKKNSYDDLPKLSRIYSMQIYKYGEDRRTYPCRPKAGLRSHTNVADEDLDANLKVV